MSRIIVKNLPKGMKEDRLRELFGERGHITDCCMKFTKGGAFRKFAFIGYKSGDQASAAVKHLNNSFLDTSKIAVEIAKDLGDANKARAWSKYSKDSSAFKKIHAKDEEVKGMTSPKHTDKKEKKDVVGDVLGDLKDDPEFQEFLEVHKNRINKSTWSNDAGGESKKSTVCKVQRADKQVSSADDSDSDGDASASTSEESGIKEKLQVSKNKKLSDLDYLKSKTTSGNLSSDSNDSNEDSSDSDDEQEDHDKNTSEPDGEKANEKGPHYRFIVKMRGLPSNVKETQIHDFFKPMAIKSVKIPKKGKGKKVLCMATVEFQSEKDQDQAMRRNKNFIGPKRIFLHKSKEDIKSEKISAPKSWEIKLAQKQGDEETEAIAESGRLYVRNLAYCCKEEDIERLFAEFGPLAEVNLPVDNFTKKVKGFAFVTYMMPEHAVQAFTKLDGSTFQGRLMHILPAKAKKEDSLQITDDMSFKKKQELRLKSQAGSSHNWNALFLGANAVADVMVDKYGTSKAQLLDADQKQSLAVRMALGETQIVSETREFLVENGVALDSFSQPSAARSKTVMLVKNLPANTPAGQLQAIFEKHGTVGQVILPPSGITAIVEFVESSEAKKAFRNLAYTKFEHVPLYLEWAPMNIFTDVKETDECKEENKKEEGSSDEDDDAGSPEPGSCLFVKNLNFDTSDETLAEHFASCGKIQSATVAKKKDLKKPGSFLSMGYGFVTFYNKEVADKALKTRQHSKLEDHQLELKISNRDAVVKQPLRQKKKQEIKKQKTTKILVRNIPFEAKHKEVQELFSVFGELKTVRLPKKMSGTGSHRGFAFVDFLSRQDAKRAFKALCHSTHLYGRRLVLEWADTEDTVDKLRKKTAQHFYDDKPTKKFKKSNLIEELKATEIVD